MQCRWYARLLLGMNKSFQMKKIVILWVIFCFAATLPADAQFWKKKEKPAPRKKTVVARPKEPTKEAPKKKTREISYPKSITKERYRIDVLLPLYLDDIVKNDKIETNERLPEKAQNGIHFYQGLKLAADSLSQSGYQVDVYVHDIAQKDSTPEALIQYQILATSDLIIGAVSSYQIAPLANYAKKRKINFVSVLSPADGGITDNPYFTIAQPTLITYIKKMRATVVKKYNDKPILLLYRTHPSVDSTAYQYVYENAENKFTPLLINQFPQGFRPEELLDSTRVNAIVMPIIDYAYAQSVLDYLQKYYSNYRFEIFGLPSWRSIAKIRKSGEYANIEVNYSAPFYYNTSSEHAQMLTKKYREVFGGRLNEMNVRGYETLMMYATYLKLFGTIFNDKINELPNTLSTYKILPQWTEENDLLYFENTHFATYRYNDGSYSVTE